MNKKFKFLTFALTAVTLFSFGGCNMKDKIEQTRCEHEMNDGEVTKSATCENVGEKLLTCDLCGYEETEYIPATGHTWQKIEEIAPTCTEAGDTDGVICVTCQEYFITPAKIPALGHSDVTDMGYAPTCTETGLTDGSHCSVCNEVITAQENLPANGHNIVTVAGKAATCMETGLTDGQVCKNCSFVYVKQEEIARVGHVDKNSDDFCDVCGYGTLIEVGEQDILSFGRYRIYRYDFNLMFDMNLFQVDGISLLVTLTVGSSTSQAEGDVLSLSPSVASQDIIEIYSYENYIEFVFKDGTGMTIDGEVITARPSDYDVMPYLEDGFKGFYKIA